jgi:hypothetical protein
MARFVDPARYRALVRALGGVLAVLVAIDVALRLALGIAPPALLRASFHDRGNRELVAGRISAVIAERAAVPIAVVVGSSSAYDGLVPSALGAADPRHRRWLNLAMTGSSFDELRYTFGPLFASDLGADVVVLAVHPGWLAGRLVGDPVLDAILIPDAPRTSWLLFDRGMVNHVARSALAGAREWLLLRLGVAFPAVYPPVHDPWAEHAPEHDVRDPELVKNQLELWRHKHWFDASWFARAGDELDAAAEVIAACQRVARRVVIVLMPEASPLRTAMPAEAEAALRRALARLPAPPPVIDLRAAIADERFVDNIHLGARGARELSAIVAARPELAD